MRPVRPAPLSVLRFLPPLIDLGGQGRAVRRPEHGLPVQHRRQPVVRTLKVYAVEIDVPPGRFDGAVEHVGPRPVAGLLPAIVRPVVTERVAGGDRQPTFLPDVPARRPVDLKRSPTTLQGHDVRPALRIKSSTARLLQQRPFRLQVSTRSDGPGAAVSRAQGKQNPITGPAATNAAAPNTQRERRRRSPAAGASTTSGKAQSHRGPNKITVGNHQRSPPTRSSSHTANTPAR